MARPLRPDFPGAIWHAYNRGVNYNDGGDPFHTCLGFVPGFAEAVGFVEARRGASRMLFVHPVGRAKSEHGLISVRLSKWRGDRFRKINAGKYWPCSVTGGSPLAI